MGDDVFAYKAIKQNRKYLTKHQYKVLRGQIKAGSPAAAMKGLVTILNRRNEETGTPGA